MVLGWTTAATFVVAFASFSRRPPRRARCLIDLGTRSAYRRAEDGPRFHRTTPRLAFFSYTNVGPSINLHRSDATTRPLHLQLVTAAMHSASSRSCGYTVESYRHASDVCRCCLCLGSATPFRAAASRA